MCFVDHGQWNADFNYFEGPPDLDLLWKNLEALLPYRVNSNPPPVLTPTSLSVAKFFESVPSFLPPDSVVRGRRVEPAEDVVVDDSEIRILLNELREVKRHIPVVEKYLETSQIDCHYVDEDTRVDLNGLHTVIDRHLEVILTMHYPDASAIQEKKHPIPRTEQSDVSITLGCFEKGVMFQGFRKGTAEAGLDTYKGPTT